MIERPAAAPLGVGERFDEIARCMAEGHRLRAEAAADAVGWLAGLFARPLRRQADAHRFAGRAA